MIKAIRFQNYKVLRDTTLPLGNFTLLLGPNGSGKSTAISALQKVRTLEPRGPSQLIASASATVGNCDLVDIVVIYGGQLVIQPGAAFQSSFTAILDQTVVDFHAYCVTPSGGPIVTPDQYIDITVAPAP